MLRRNSLLLLRCAKKLNTSSIVLYSKFDKHLPHPHLPTPISRALGPDTDILLDQLKGCKSVEKILELVDMHLSVMNSKHVVQCFQSIHNAIRDNRAINQSLQENRIFQSLCSRLMKVVRLFEPQDVITTYKTLSELDVPSNTYLMQCVLKMLGAHLNHMNLGQLVFLNFLLHKQRHNTLVDGLKLALPLVLQVQIDQQLDSDNVTEVVNCLQVACRAHLKTATIEKVLHAVLQKASILSVENATTVIFSLLSLETPVDRYKELINAAFEIVLRNIQELEEKHILSLLGACRSTRFYHTKFLFTVADHIVQSKWSLSRTYLAFISISKLQFCPSHLIDHFSEVLRTDPCSYHKEEKMFSPLNCIEFLTMTSYRPLGVDEAAKILYSDEKKLQNYLSRMPHLLIKFLSHLAMIGHFPTPILTKSLEEDFLYEAWSSSKQQGRSLEFERNLLTMSWALNVYSQQDKFNIPASLLHKFISHVYQRNLSAEYPLSTFIENGLGGSHFLQNGVFTRDGHVIDHVVAMRSGNYPVSLQNTKAKDLVFVEDFVLPEDTKIIAVIVASEGEYCRDPEILKGEIDFKLKSLSNKNFAPVAINFGLWKNLPDREKIPYLMREIKQAVEDDAVSKIIYS